jgi:hypothetical protein
VNREPVRNFRICSWAIALIRGEAVRILERDALIVKAGGRAGNGCVGYGFSPGTLLSVGTGRSSIGRTGLPVTRSNTCVKPAS